MNVLENFVFPRRCAVCGRLLAPKMKYICGDCLSDLPFTYFWNWKDNPAEMILYGRTHFDRVCSLFYYSRDNDYSSLVHRVKYYGDIGLGRYLGGVLGKLMRKQFGDVDYIIPVPIHFLRRWKRGYNQSEYIALGINDGLGRGKVLSNALCRRKYASSQTSVSMSSKWENVSNAFILKPSFTKVLKGKSLLLVDDVLTSGATSEVCFDALSVIEEVKISLATLAYVRK